MKEKIKLIVLDIDGVIIGEKIGYNSPDPHKEVIKALFELKQKGFIVSFCTGKPYLAIKNIVEDADLYNLHITDGGAVLMDPISNTMVLKTIVPSKIASDIIKTYIKANEYVEFYTPTDYYIQRNQKGLITTKHTQVLQKAPKQVADLSKAALSNEVTKVMVIAEDEINKEKPNKIFETHYINKLNLRWGLHPVINPLQFGVITAKEISKGQMLKNLASEYSIDTDNILAIGDSTSDWDFMQIAGYVATVDNGQSQLKDLVQSKDKNGFIGDHVDKNGIISILKHFRLLG